MDRAVDKSVAEALVLAHHLLDEAGIWHCLAYGSLLGAVRDGSVIAWDTDFDMFVAPSDVPRILRLRHPEMEFRPVTKAGAELAIGSARVPFFNPCRLAAFHHQRKIGDIYFPVLFSDGVLRTYDLEREVLWTPQSSFPHFFLQQLRTVQIDGTGIPGPRFAEKFLAGVYGDDWEAPYRAVQQGGDSRPGTTTHGDRYRPKLGYEVQWCRQHGWDDTVYGAEPSWPRDVVGAGPIGPTPETAATSRGLWWRDRFELVANF